MTAPARKGRPPLVNPMVHTAIVLPAALIANLRTAASLAGHGLATEIRARLVDSLIPEQTSPTRAEAMLLGLRDELAKAMSKHRSMASAHEGHSVIREELEELWDHVKADTGHTEEARKEALQVAAMGLRYALDVCG